MKRLACAVSLILFAGSTTALAADYGAPPPPPVYAAPPPVYAAPPPPPVYPIYPIFSWSGIYVGINGGAGTALLRRLRFAAWFACNMTETSFGRLYQPPTPCYA
jgi:hypothetical protein